MPGWFKIYRKQKNFCQEYVVSKNFGRENKLQAKINGWMETKKQKPGQKSQSAEKERRRFAENVDQPTFLSK